MYPLLTKKGGGEKRRAFEVGFSLGLFSLQKIKLLTVINFFFFFCPNLQETQSGAHIPQHPSLFRTKRKAHAGYSFILQRYKGLHYTVGKVRRNVSIETEGKEEPRAQSTGKSFPYTGYTTSIFHKTRLAPPSLHFEGMSGTLKCRNNLRQHIVSGNPTLLVIHFHYWQCRQPWGKDIGAVRFPYASHISAQGNLQ